jgi:hypothetical protein
MSHIPLTMRADSSPLSSIHGSPQACERLKDSCNRFMLTVAAENADHASNALATAKHELDVAQSKVDRLASLKPKAKGNTKGEFHTRIII